MNFNKISTLETLPKENIKFLTQNITLTSYRNTEEFQEFNADDELSWYEYNSLIREIRRLCLKEGIDCKIKELDKKKYLKWLEDEKKEDSRAVRSSFIVIQNNKQVMSRKEQSGRNYE